MPKFGRASLANLNTCHPKLVKIAYRVIAKYDVSIIEGHRGEEAQNEAYDSGNSNVKWPEGNHNKKPSRALDALPYPSKWKSTDRQFIEMAAHFMKAAEEEGVRIKLGMFFIVKGKLFFDAAHVELHESEV